MATHIEVMRGAVGKPLAAVKKAVETVKSGGRPAEDIYLSDMVEELLALDLVKNKKVPVRRIFVHSDEGGAYNDVGWILLDDVEYCMLCKRAFGVFASKFSCHACGNVFCSQCSSQEAFIFEIQHVGKLRVCDLCCYGQVRKFVFSLSLHPLPFHRVLILFAAFYMPSLTCIHPLVRFGTGTSLRRAAHQGGGSDSPLDRNVSSNFPVWRPSPFRRRRGRQVQEAQDAAAG